MCQLVSLWVIYFSYLNRLSIYSFFFLDIYTIILLKSVYLSVCLSQLANCRSQLLLDNLGRCLKLFVSTESTSCHEFASQFGLDFCIREKHSKPRGIRTASASVYFNGQRPAIVASGAGRHGWVPPDPSNSDILNDGDGGVRVCVCACERACERACMCACVHACVICLKYTIIIFDPG